jgi:effector-binding domain-containing protein
LAREERRRRIVTVQCEVRSQERQPVLSVRTRTHVDHLPQAMAKAYAAIVQYMGELGTYPSGPPFAAYFNTDMEDLDVELGMPVAEEQPGKDDIQASEIPAGQVVTCVHVGPYSALEPSYSALSEFVHEQGLEPTGVAYEIYLDDPQSIPEEEMKTRIVFPLK